MPSCLVIWRREGALEGTVRLPFGQVPAAWCVDQQISDLVVHGWDIARATGQPTELDPELGQASLAWARQNLLPELRGDVGSGYAFGPEVPVPETAPLHDRFAAFFDTDGEVGADFACRRMPLGVHRALAICYASI